MTEPVLWIPLGKMDAALKKVRKTIGRPPGLTDNEIRDYLWDLYYDVPKTVDRILSMCCCSMLLLHPSSSELMGSAWIIRRGLPGRIGELSEG